jgi:dUTP pyrophosphatase
MMTVKVKKLHPDAVIPKYAKPGDAGLDLTAISHEFEQEEVIDEEGKACRVGRKLQVYGTGLAFEIPEGYVGLIFPRSSIAKTSLSLTNCVGVIDSGYRGEVKFKFAIDSGSRPTQNSSYKVGDRIGQLIIMPYPQIELVESDELSDTARGAGGFGSSGK